MLNAVGSADLAQGLLLDLAHALLAQPVLPADFQQRDARAAGQPEAVPQDAGLAIREPGQSRIQLAPAGRPRPGPPPAWARSGPPGRRRRVRDSPGPRPGLSSESVLCAACSSVTSSPSSNTRASAICPRRGSLPLCIRPSRRSSSMRESSPTRLLGTRIRRPFSCIAFRIAWRIHQIGVRDEMDAPFGVEPFRRLDEPDVALVDEVFQGNAAVAVLLGHQDHEAQVRLDQALPGLPVPLGRQPGAGLFFLAAQSEGSCAAPAGRGPACLARP